MHDNSIPTVFRSVSWNHTRKRRAAPTNATERGKMCLIDVASYRPKKHPTITLSTMHMLAPQRHSIHKPAYRESTPQPVAQQPSSMPGAVDIVARNNGVLVTLDITSRVCFRFCENLEHGHLRF
jgi:hypothetical protein